MATDVERLAVLIEANTKSYERAMTRIEQKTNASMRRSSTHVRSLDARMKSLNATAVGLGRTFAASLGVGVGAAGIVGTLRKVQDSVEKLDAIAKTARTIGLTGEALQELRFAASRAGVGVSEFDTAMIRLARTLGQAQRGQASQLKLFEDLGVSIRDAGGRARDVDSVFRDVADAITKIRDPALSVAMTMEIFGRSGARMARFLGQGADEMARLREQARSTGAVISEDILVRSEQAADKLGDLTQVIEAQLTVAFFSLAPVITRVLNEFVRFIDDVHAGIQEIDDLIAKITWLNNRLNDLADTFGRFTGLRSIGEALGTIDPVAERIAQAMGDAGETAESRSLARALRSQAFRVARTAASGAHGDGDGFGGAGGGGRDKAAKDLERQQERVSSLIDDLEHELRVMGLSEEQRRVENALRNAGSAATDEQRAKIEALTREIYAQEEAQERLNEQMQFFGDIAESSLSALILSGRQAEDVIADLVRQLARAAIQASLLGQGPLAGLFGTKGTGGLFGAFGGSFATGGTLGAGKWGIAGERGPEIIRGPASITPMAANGNVTAPITVHMDARGADRDGIMQAVARLERELPQRAVAAVRDAQSRRAI